ncbi:MAG: hypothetical protein WAT63_06005 [Rhodoferax sp.]
MGQPKPSTQESAAEPASLPPAAAFDPDKTISYQARLRHAPGWFHSFLAGNSREKNRMRSELSKIKGAIPLLMKPRNGLKWTTQDRRDLQRMLRAASAVYPYLIIWALPGSILLLPFLAWHLDARRKNRERKAGPGPAV